ncbi:MAG: bifunctional GTP diphosphokinase/guanosine-3',5'-bis pyrophosphate 3'-pyrophosphohydrolase [Gammaproteobacteria bacterium]
MAELASATSKPVTSRDPTRFQVSELCAIMESYLEPEQVRDVYRSYLFSAEAHSGQTRLTGEPYINHPLAVAKTMAEMHMDADSIMAAILHDVIEDTPTAKEQLAAEFGKDVAELVDGVSKLTHLTFESKAEAQAANFRKMMLAMVKDIRVVMVKLADRLHNMRTLSVMPADKRKRIARETLEIYAPIAQRLGMNALRVELEQLGFQTLYPMRYRIIEEAVRRTRGHRKEVMNKIEAGICEALEQAGIESRIYGREKNLYSIYKKMQSKRLSFAEVFDVFAIRLVVGDVDTCYRALGVIHNLFKPVPGRFKDYIAIPKVNGYQSLHTVLFSPHGVSIEAQIRTEEMDRIAQSGIAAHWLYKAGDHYSAKAQTRAQEWLKDVLEIQQSAGNSIEFLESVRVDLFPDEVYVFTPVGEIMELPHGATAVDFAYAVHSDVGNTCVAVKIDRRLAPLSSVLASGQTVEVITAPGARPNAAWLNFVVTAKARAAIRHALKNLKSEEAVQLGSRLLDKALASHDSSLGKIHNKHLRATLKEIGVKKMDALLEDIGLGNRMAPLIARRLLSMEDDSQQLVEERAGRPRALEIKGTEGMVVTFAKCCHPIPGDPIVGAMSTGRGLVIHRDSCSNLTRQRSRPDQTIHVEWSKNADAEFSAAIRVVCVNQRGMLATVAAKIADMGSNIENVSFEERVGSTSTITFQQTVKSRKDLARLMRAIRNHPQVYKVMRLR